MAEIHCPEINGLNQPINIHETAGNGQKLIAISPATARWAVKLSYYAWYLLPMVIGMFGKRLFNSIVVCCILLYFTRCCIVSYYNILQCVISYIVCRGHLYFCSRSSTKVATV